MFFVYLLDGWHCDFPQFWYQSHQQQYWRLSVVWGEEKFLVRGLWRNSSNQKGVLIIWCNWNVLLVVDRRCKFCIQIRHKHFLWEVGDYIPPRYLWVLPSQGSKHIHSRLCCWKEWCDKIWINQYKWTELRLRKWCCWEVYWLWWYQQFVCRFLLDN